MRSKTAAHAAFTLIELLVVVAVIAVLIAVLLPALARTRESARRVQCASNMRQIMLGLHLYAGENRGWYPPYGFVGRPGCDDGAGGSWWSGYDSGGNQIGAVQGGVGSYTARQGKYIQPWTLMFCPNVLSELRSSFHLASYVPGWWENLHNDGGGFSGYFFFNGNGPAVPGYKPEWFAGRLRDSSSKVIFADRAQVYGGTDIWLRYELDFYGMPLTNHPNGANIAFNDTHVTFYTFPGPRGLGRFRMIYNTSTDAVAGHE